MNKIQKFLAVTGLVFISFSFAQGVFAQSGVSPLSDAAQRANCEELKKQFSINNSKVSFNNFLPTRFCTVTDVVDYIIKAALALAASAAIIFIMVGGFWLITAAGNEEQAEKGRKVLTNSVIGLIVVIMAYAIVRIVINLITGNPADTGGSPVSPDTTNNTNQPSSNTPNTSIDPAKKITFQGNNFADPNSAYTFTITVPADAVKQICGSAVPAAYVNAATKYGTVNKVGGLSYGNNELSGSLSTDIVSNYGYGTSGSVGDSLPLSLYVCGQSMGGWDITVKSAVTGKPCNPDNNNMYTQINSVDCGGFNQTCDAETRTCVPHTPTNCDQGNNDEENNGVNMQDCGVGQTCNSQGFCQSIQSANQTDNTVQGALSRSGFTASLSGDGKEIDIKINSALSDRQKICGNYNFSQLSTGKIDLLVNGTVAQSATADDQNVLVLSYTNKISSPKTITVKICDRQIGSPVTINPPIR